jgi:hypothetical protein
MGHKYGTQIPYPLGDLHHTLSLTDSIYVWCILLTIVYRGISFCMEASFKIFSTLRWAIVLHIRYKYIYYSVKNTLTHIITHDDAQSLP